MIEFLEPRIAPAMIFTYTELDESAYLSGLLNVTGKLAGLSVGGSGTDRLGNALINVQGDAGMITIAGDFTRTSIQVVGKLSGVRIGGIASDNGFRIAQIFNFGFPVRTEQTRPNRSERWSTVDGLEPCRRKNLFSAGDKLFHFTGKSSCTAHRPGHPAHASACLPHPVLSTAYLYPCAAQTHLCAEQLS